MILDQTTRRALDLDRILERIARLAVSSTAREHLLASEPATGAAEARDRQAPVAEAMRLAERDIPIPVHGLFDVLPCFEEARIEGSAVPHDRWPRLAVFLEVCDRVARFGRERAGEAPVLSAEAAGIEPEPALLESIGRLFEKRGGEITPELRDDASPGLSSVRRRMRSAEQGLMKTIGRLVNEYTSRGWLQEAFSTIRNGRHVLPFRASSKSRVTGIHHGSSSTGETVFIEPAEIVELANLIDELRGQEVAEEVAILRALTARLRTWVPAGAENMRRLARLDAWAAIARHAHSHGWTFPVMAPRGPLRMIAAHHPHLHLERRAESVPIGMALSAGDRVVVFSGPNTGGKTTAMRTVGLCALLLQCGIPVPMSPDSTMPVFDGVLADIGDSQDLSAGVSTFSGHVRRLSEIIRSAGETTGALVLLDELGTGTDPKEGSALAVAILERLKQTGALTFATSHYEAVKLWPGETQGARNASFALDESTRRPTYRVRFDMPGASEALEIARNEGLDRGVLDRARELLGPQHLRLGELLRRIEDTERRLAQSLRDAEARSQALAEQEALAKARAEQLREERRQAKAALAEERESVLREAREKLERLIAELPGVDALPARKEALVEARRDVIGSQHRNAQELRGLREADPARTRDPQLPPGRRVYVRSLSDYAEVIEAIPGRDKVRLLMGRIEVEVPRSELLERDPHLRRLPEPARPQQEPAAGKPKRSRKLKAALEEAESLPPERGAFGPQRTAPQVRTPSVGASIYLDLHGKRVEEALPLLDKHIDNALLAGMPFVKICHGQGSGKLYRAVHEFLRGHPSVESFRFATPDEGGGGMTIVEL